MSEIQKLLGGQLLQKSRGNSIQDVTNVDENCVIGIYFSAHWCPPCRNFTPVLSKFYENANKDGKILEIVFVSSDQDQGSFDQYYNTMPFMALPYHKQAIKQSLSQKFGIQSIPSLIIISKEGQVISNQARNQVINSQNDPKSLVQTWKDGKPQQPQDNKQNGINIQQIITQLLISFILIFLTGEIAKYFKN